MSRSTSLSRTTRLSMPLLAALLGVATVGLGPMSFSSPAQSAEQVTSDSIIRALTPKRPLTRSLTLTPPADTAAAAKETGFINSVRNRTTRSLSLNERTELSEIAATKPTIDLEIHFDHDSATISRNAKSTVDALGKALTNDALQGSTFMLAGHTDAKGADGYNQDLSERRADAIKRALVADYGIKPENLVTVGYGKSAPKDPQAPLDPSNRRVQIVNMTDKATASR